MGFNILGIRKNKGGKKIRFWLIKIYGGEKSEVLSTKVPEIRNGEIFWKKNGNYLRVDRGCMRQEGEVGVE